MISVIIPITGANRKRHVVTCLRMLRNQTYKNFEIVLIEQINCELLEAPTKARYYKKSGADKYLAIENKINGLFNQPWMANVGAKIADGDQLLFYDIDIVTGPNYLKAVSEFPDPYFLAWKHCHHLTKEVSEVVHRKNKILKDKNATTYAASGTHYAGYTVCARRNFFFDTLGCYNENLFGWGGNDNEIAARAAHYMGHPARALPRPIFHLWHPRSYAKSNKNNRSCVFTARKYPKKVTERLRRKSLGNPKNPTLINLDDIAVTK